MENKEPEITGRELFNWILALILWTVCMFSFKTVDFGSFLTTLGKSTGISFGFLLVCYACDEDTWKEESKDTDKEIFLEQSTSFGFDRDVAEQYYDDRYDPWVLEYESKYGSLEEQQYGEKKKLQTNIRETKDGAIFIGASAVAVHSDAIAIGSSAYYVQRETVSIETGKGNKKDAPQTRDWYFAENGDMMLFDSEIPGFRKATKEDNPYAKNQV